MKIGIAGWRGSGKTTLFEALSGIYTKHDYSDRIGVHNVKVPDIRVDMLSSIYKPKKISYADIDYIDFPGFDREHQKSGISRQHIQRLKELDGFLVVLNGFSADQDYMGDRDEFVSEIMISDLILAEQRLSALKKANNLEGEYPVIEKIFAKLEKNVPVKDLELSDAETDLIRHYRFLSHKPCLFIVNSKDEEMTGTENKDESMFFINALLEKEITELNPEDQNQFYLEMGYNEPLKNRIIYRVYSLLKLISFLTVNANEVKAWPVTNGSTAIKAASKVHTDIARGFIRAEVISYEDFSGFKSVAMARKAGKVRSEGREYVVKDGDIIEFRFNI